MSQQEDQEKKPNNKQAYYFVNAPIDIFFIGGASFLLFAALPIFYTELRTPEIIAAGIFLSWIINWPHFSMSTYRLYQSKSNINRYPVTAYFIPFLVIGGTILAFSYPILFAPIFVKIFLIWSPYHFSGQTIGISFVYARRTGINLSALERKVFIWFIYFTYFTSTIGAEVAREGYDFYSVHYPTLGIPFWVAEIAKYGMWIALVVFVLLVAHWCMRNKRVMPLIVVLPAATQYLWFVQSVYMPAFQEFVPLLHSFQYMIIAWGIQLKEKLDVRKIEPSKSYVMKETFRWYSLNFVGGAFLFYMLPIITSSFGQPKYFSIAIIFAAIQIHHFFVDGVIWKLRNSTVSHPLMMNIKDISGSNKLQKIKP